MAIYQGTKKISENVTIVQGATIDDSLTSADKVWSSEKVSTSCIPMKAFDLSADIDLNDSTKTGYYSLNNDTSSGAFTHSLLNFPETTKPAGGFGLDVRSYGSNSNWCTQTVYIYSGNHADVWYRVRYYSAYKEVWGDWERIAKYSKTLSINQSFTANTWNVINTDTGINWWADSVVAVFKAAYESSSGTQVFGAIRVNATTGKLEFRPEANCDFVVIHTLGY